MKAATVLCALLSLALAAPNANTKRASGFVCMFLISLFFVAGMTLTWDRVRNERVWRRVWAGQTPRRAGDGLYLAQCIDDQDST
jgi:hypothetical protein